MTMTSPKGSQRQVSNAQLNAIENQLFTLVRTQSKRLQPVELPSPDFWENVAMLLSNIEVELSEVGKTEGWSVKAQNLSRKQANIRRAVADLTQHRLTAFVRHAASSNLESAPFGDAMGDPKSSLSALDWSRHDVSERAFYEGLGELIEKYKRHVSWAVLQKGLLSGEDTPPIIAPGATQLDAFTDAPLTESGPPEVKIAKPEADLYEEPDEDEEDRISRMDAYASSTKIPTDFKSGKLPAPIPEKSDEDEKIESKESEVGGMIRIKMVQDLPAPIMDPDGKEVELMAGDVGFYEEQFAQGLIAAGFAEDASI